MGPASTPALARLQLTPISHPASPPTTSRKNVVGSAVRYLTSVPKRHSTDPLERNADPAAITGFVLGGILVAAILGYAGYRGYLTYQANKRGAIQLEE